MAMASLIESGVLHRHPKLRVGFMEAVYGTDYPHTDHKLHATRDLERLIERLGRPVAEKLVWSNANRLFGMTD